MEQTPWINEEKIRVGQIGPEERKAIDAQLVRLLAAHRRGTDVPGTHRECSYLVCGAVTKPKRKGKCSPEHGDRLRAYNTARAAARARKREEAANGPDKIKVRFLEAYAAGVVAPSDLAAA
jgi:hypothetical protein